VNPKGCPKFVWFLLVTIHLVPVALSMLNMYQLNRIQDHDVSNDDSRQDSQDQQSTLENGENFYNLRRRKSLVSLSSARYDYSEEEHLLSKEGDTNQQALSSPDPQRRRLSMDYDSDDDSVDMLSIDSLIGAPAKPASATKTMRSASVH
jgi:hypothetical protein